MYAYIKGILTGSSENDLIIENNGIGYRIHTSKNTLSEISNSQTEVKVYTYLHVREDIYSLYGFYSPEELHIFELLISVSGVGPKAALAITSTLTPSKFCLCVSTGDSKLLSQSPGVGKKTAERIILELKDKILKEHRNQKGSFDLFNPSSPQKSSIIEEALEALMVLGYAREDSLSALLKNANSEIEIEPLIKEALKALSSTKIQAPS